MDESDKKDNMDWRARHWSDEEFKIIHTRIDELHEKQLEIIALLEVLAKKEYTDNKFKARMRLETTPATQRFNRFNTRSNRI